MTPIGSNLVEELVSELNQKIEDDKKKIQMKQGANYLAATLRGLIRIPEAICLTVLMLLVLGLFVIDIDMITSFRSATDLELMDAVKVLKFMAFFISLFVASFIGVRAIRSQEELRRMDDRDIVNQVKNTVEIIEEVLIRHNLISIKGIENVQKID